MATILQIVPRLETGGSEQATVDIAAAVTRAGATALIATEGGRMEADLARVGAEVVRLPVASKNPATILANIGRLTDLIETRNVSLVHARSRAPAWSGFFAARQTDRPFVTTYHGSYSGRAPFKTLYNSVMARGARVIANSNYTARLISARHHVPPERMRAIYRGIDLTRFSPDAVEPERLDRLRAAWGLSEGTPVILQAARVTRLKGHTDVIEAVRQLRGAGRLGDAIVILAGDAQGRDAYRKDLEGRIRAAGLQDRVRLVGHCDDVPAAFALATGSIVASTVPETFGRTCVESQAMACPVIVTDIGATPENVVAAPAEDFTGWVVPPSDPAALADAIGQLLAVSGDDRATIGQRGRAHVTGRFALRTMQRATLAVYDELLGTDLAAHFDAPALAPGSERSC